MSAPLKARRLTDPEGQKLQRIVRRGSTHPTKLGLPFTRWSLRKLAAYLAHKPGPGLRIGRESLRALLHRNGITFQRTTTWKDSPDTPHAIPNSTASSTSWSTFPTGSLPSTSSTPGASAPLPPRTPCPRPRAEPRGHSAPRCRSYGQEKGHNAHIG